MKLALVMSAALALSPAGGLRSDHVTIEGSSTVAPFAREVAQLLTDETKLRVVQDGSGSGLARLCGGAIDAPPVAAASRRVRPNELERCEEAGLSEIIEKAIGRDGIVVAQSKKAKKIELSTRDLYLAVAQYHPRSDHDCVLVKNSSSNWREINPQLPKRQITTIGPPRSSGTRDVLVSLALKRGARTFPCLAHAETQNPEFFERATRIRLDSHWVDGGEHDEAIATTLRYVPHAIGIFGYAYLLESDGVVAISLDGVKPEADTIASGDYALSRGLYLYTTPSAYQSNPTISEVFRAFDSFAATGPDGLLTRMGLVTRGGPVPLRTIGTDASARAAHAAELKMAEGASSHGGHGSDGHGSTDGHGSDDGHGGHEPSHKASTEAGHGDDHGGGHAVDPHMVATHQPASGAPQGYGMTGHAEPAHQEPAHREPVHHDPEPHSSAAAAHETSSHEEAQAAHEAGHGASHETPDHHEVTEVAHERPEEHHPAPVPDAAPRPAGLRTGPGLPQRPAPQPEVAVASEPHGHDDHAEPAPHH